MVRTTIDAVVDPLNACGRWRNAGGEDHVAMGFGREVTLFLGEDQLRELRDECDRLLLKKAHMDIDRENQAWEDAVAAERVRFAPAERVALGAATAGS